VAVLIAEETRCPACRSRAFRYQELLYDMPHFGNVLVETGYCSVCGYRLFDIEYADVGRPTRIIFAARDGEDVARSYLIRSKTGTVYSPDLGFSLEPALGGEPMIITVEGLLYRVADYAEKLKVLEPGSAQRVDEFIRRVYRAIESGGFTLVVEDPLGKSLIKPYRPESIRVEYL